MTARQNSFTFRVLSLIAITSATLLAQSAARAQATGDIPVPDVANANTSFQAEVVGTGVYVKSGPGESYYPTQKLDAGASVHVVGIKFDWLKIVPPQGSFSYVAKAYVDKNADGTGTVNRDDVRVRTGSSLNTVKTSVQCMLNKGEQVKILDEKDEYYIIQPPNGAYVFIHQKNVKPVKALPAVVDNKVPTPDNAIATGNANANNSQPPTRSTELTQPPVPTTDTNIAGTATNVATAAPASTQPTADVEFDKIEIEFADASKKTIEQQPIDDLLGRYQKLIANRELPESMRRIGEFRVAALKARAEAKDQFVAVQKMQAESQKKQQALKAEQDELQQQIKKNEVKMYAAVGTLRTSSLQNGPAALYRLTDPQTGRTVVYIRTADQKYAALLNQFIGVKGEIATESNLSMKVVTPTDAEAVDPANVFKSVAAQVVPPSLLPQAAQPAAENTQPAEQPASAKTPTGDVEQASTTGN